MKFKCICSEFDLRAQSFCWEAGLVKDCHSNREIKRLQQLHYMLDEDVTRLLLQHGFKETRVRLFLEKVSWLTLLNELCYMWQSHLPPFGGKLVREGHLEKSVTGLQKPGGGALLQNKL